MRVFFLKIGKRVMLFQFIKKTKNLIKNYQPIGILPIFSKVFERLVFNALFNLFLYNKLFTPCQSGFNFHPPTDMRGTFL